MRLQYAQTNDKPLLAHGGSKENKVHFQSSQSEPDTTTKQRQVTSMLPATLRTSTYEQGVTIRCLQNEQAQQVQIGQTKVLDIYMYTYIYIQILYI